MIALELVLILNTPYQEKTLMKQYLEGLAKLI